ncbi:MAG: hypothetical protein EOP83_07830 [Verrucomicrobiaceae bacterium]|nr:MAG: hypothetical protein EOP83_07830 [Verrucomicrobiaceae bacterium]
MIRHGWIYLTAAQEKRLFEERAAVRVWLAERHVFMADAYGFITSPRYTKRKVTIRAVDARDDFDAETALFEFKMPWL